MSRHTRHRLNEQRRLGPNHVEGSQPVRLAVPDSAVATTPIAPPVAPPVASPVAPPPVEPVAPDAHHAEPSGPLNTGCTPAQLRRFIKSRAYLPVHEIRRRFGIESQDDDVTGFTVGSGRIFVGLPPREGQILGELVRAGEVGYELQLDPEAPIIVGVYPMRPVTRQ